MSLISLDAKDIDSIKDLESNLDAKDIDSIKDLELTFQLFQVLQG